MWRMLLYYCALDLCVAASIPRPRGYCSAAGTPPAAARSNTTAWLGLRPSAYPHIAHRKGMYASLPTAAAKIGRSCAPASQTCQGLVDGHAGERVRLNAPSRGMAQDWLPKGSGTEARVPGALGATVCLRGLLMGALPRWGQQGTWDSG